MACTTIESRNEVAEKLMALRVKGADQAMDLLAAQESYDETVEAILSLEDQLAAQAS